MRLALYFSCLAVGVAGAAAAVLIARDNRSSPAPIRPTARVPAADPTTVRGRVA